MTITPAQLESLKKRLGASELASAFGYDPWRTPYELWAQKTGKIERDDATSHQQYLGNAYETATIGCLQDATGKMFNVHPQEFRRGKWLVAHPDGTGLQDMQPAPFIAEVKMTGLATGWGESGSSDVPRRVLCQVYGGAICYGANEGYVGVLLALPRRHEFRWYRIEIDPTLADAILERAEQWWDMHVVCDIPPPLDPLPDLDVTRAIRRVAGKSVEVDEQLIAAAWVRRQERLAAEKMEDAAFARLEAAMGDASIAVCRAGEYELRVENAGRRLDTVRLRAEHPAIWEEYAKDLTRKMPRFRLPSDYLPPAEDRPPPGLDGDHFTEMTVRPPAGLPSNDQQAKE